MITTVIHNSKFYSISILIEVITTATDNTFTFSTNLIIFLPVMAKDGIMI